MRENIELTKGLELDTASILISLRNSGAFDSNLDWEKLSSKRMGEIRRKEGVIRQKDSKATRLIEIIRGKNNKIGELRNYINKLEGFLTKKHCELDFMKGSLSMVSEVVNNNATVVWHPEISRSVNRSERSGKQGSNTWEDWIRKRFNQSL
jgi:hypothetical protein